MYVESLELINIRSFKKAVIEFSSSINLLVGPNNSGKSTIIKALYTLQEGTSNSINRKEDIRITEKFGRIFIELSQINAKEKVLFKNKKTNKGRIADTDEQSVAILLSTNESNEDIKFETIFYKKENPSSYGQVYRNLESRERLIVTDDRIFPGFSSMENQNNFIYPFFSRRKTNYYSSGRTNDSFNVYDDLRNLPAIIQKLSNSSHPKNQDFVKYCDEILGFRIGVVPGINNDTDQKLGAFVTGSSFVFLESMGEGVANIIGLIAILLTEDRKLYLIEELENDIHPAALKKLLELIIKKSDSNQFIISTHSNIVLKYLASEKNSKLFKTEWQGSDDTELGKLNISTSTVRNVENTIEERLHILEDLGYDLFDFDFFKAYLIFEESSAEQIIKEFIIPVYFKEWIGKIGTIAAKGASDVGPKFNDLHRLFLYTHTSPIYHKKVWAIADGDIAGIAATKELKKSFKTWAETHFQNLSKNNFESYYPSRFEEEAKVVLAIKDERIKFIEKGKLTKKVIEWINDNPEKAKEEFATSANEVILLLKTIFKNIDTKTQ